MSNEMRSGNGLVGHNIYPAVLNVLYSSLHYQSTLSQTLNQEEPKHFAFFANMLPELCFMIWEYLVPEGQLITIKSEYGIDPTTNLKVLVNPLAVFYKIWPLLHLCKESREFAKKYFTLMWADRLGGAGVWIGAKDITYCDDPRSSMLFVGNHPLPGDTHNRPAIQLPLRPLHDIAAIAFRHFPAAFERNLETFYRLGQPPRIYLLRRGRALPHDHSTMQFDLNTAWQDEDAEARAAGYAAPEVRCLTMRRMRKDLKLLGPTKKLTRLVKGVSRDFLDRLNQMVEWKLEIFDAGGPEQTVAEEEV